MAFNFLIDMVMVLSYIFHMRVFTTLLSLDKQIHNCQIMDGSRLHPEPYSL